MLLSQLAPPSAPPTQHICTNSTYPNRRNPRRINRLRTVSVTQGGGAPRTLPLLKVLLQLRRQPYQQTLPSDFAARRPKPP